MTPERRHVTLRPSNPQTPLALQTRHDDDAPFDGNGFDDEADTVTECATVPPPAPNPT